MRFRGLVIALALLGFMGGAQAADGDLADLQLDKYRYLRSLSLDLRGYAPEVSEIEALGELEAVPEAWIADYLQSPDFQERVVRHHQALLWNNVSDQVLIHNNRRLVRTGEIYYSNNGAQVYRIERVPCLDEPATFDDDGQIIAKMQPDGSQREGYIWVTPYWQPDTPIKMCAFDAQETQVSSLGNDCSLRTSVSDAECGCGPEARWCTYGRRTDEPTLEGFAEDINRRIRDMVVEDAPYTTLFTHQYMWMNGPVATFWRNRSAMYRALRTVPLPMPEYAIPDLDYEDSETWVKVELDDHAAGILTSPAFLMRFQTNRARANRFYNAFLCQAFQPPSEGLPVVDENVIPPMDLQVREGCKYCHARLEPSASYWGRWTEQGTGFLAPDDYPAQSDACLGCALGSQSCPTVCREHYVVDALSEDQEAWLGWLNAYEFRRDEHMPNIENGPRVMALNGVVDGRLPRCVVDNTATWLLGRSPTETEADWLDDLAIEFVQQNYSYKFLVQSIVTSDAYRRVL